ncbi:uncharacterized protein LOC144017648 isoform X3 [Festucalex cinctus]
MRVCYVRLPTTACYTQKGPCSPQLGSCSPKKQPKEASGKDPIPSSCGVFVRFLVPSRRKSVGSGSPSTRRRGRGPCGSGEEEQAGESKSTAAVRAGRGIVQEVHLQGHLLVHGLHVKCFLRPRRREDVIHGQKGRKVGTRSVGKNNNNNNNNNKPENTSQFTTKTLCDMTFVAQRRPQRLREKTKEVTNV